MSPVFLTRHDLIAALRKDDPTIRVGDVMRRDIPTVTTGTRFEEAFRIMQECNCPAVPGARRNETPCRFAHPGERDRTDDGPIGHAAAPGFVGRTQELMRIGIMT